MAGFNQGFAGWEAGTLRALRRAGRYGIINSRMNIGHRTFEIHKTAQTGKCFGGTAI